MPRRHRTHLHRLAARSRGLTLIELMVTLVIAGVLAAMAVPSMHEFIIKRRVQGAADELLTDLRYARSLQLTNSKRVAVRFASNTAMSCYVIYEYDSAFTCNCLNTSTPVCTSMSSAVPQEFKTVRHLASAGVSVLPTATSATVVLLDGIDGLPVNGDTFDIEVGAPQGGLVRVRTNAVGRANACSASGHGRSYPSCP